MEDNNALLHMLGEVRGDIKVLLAHHTNMSERITNLEKSTNERLNTHSQKISTLETWQFRIAGIISVGLFVIVTFKGELLRFFGHG